MRYAILFIIALNLNFKSMPFIKINDTISKKYQKVIDKIKNDLYTI